ncbi:hypothetical protein WMY93_019259 [Mugilogobius chulae]|uniref:C-type lectin domain-containing protein n=1 Tax=Mugilogobius chulae TaxID=88201 RepID=A0AAW0NQP0_9GOBI
MSSWTWSLDEAAFDNGLNFSNWAESEPQLTVFAKICVFMDPSGLWFDELCTKTRPAVCFYEPGPAQYILVTTPMTWDQAQLYCKSNYTDLVSVRNLMENGNISTLLTNASWIGLYRQGWGQWSDQTPLTFNNFKEETQTSSVPVNCAVASTLTGQWKKASCTSVYPYVCQYYVAIDSHGQAPTAPIGPDITAEVVPSKSKNTYKFMFQSDIDLNDPHIQDQILNQLHDHLGRNVLSEHKLTWIQTEGQVFHKKTVKKDRQGC